ncbi:MAG: hypothetical protein ACJ735_00970 [Actinomycetes bacterium]
MSSRGRLRRLVIAPAVVSVVAGSLAIIGQTGSATAAATGQSSTTRAIHLRGQTSSFPSPGRVGNGTGATNLSEDGALVRYTRSGSPRPKTTTTSNGKTVLASSNTSWLPTVAATPVHSASTGLVNSWQGLGEIDNQQTAGFNVEPPDQGLCVGNGKVLEVINDVVRIYSKAGVPVTKAVSLNKFFGYPEGFDPKTNQYGPFLTDPSCAYDAATKRWYVVELTLDVNPDTGRLTLANHVDIAVSKGSNPARDGFYFYTIPTTDTGGSNGPLHTDCPCIGDFPHLGLDAHGLFVTTNEYPWSSDPGVYGNNFNGAQIYALSKYAVAAGESLVPVVQFENTFAKNGTAKIPGFAVWPTLNPGTNYPTANGGTEYFASSTAAEEAAPTTFSGHSDNVLLWSVSNTKSLDSGSPNLHLNSYVLPSESYGIPPLASQKTGPVPLKDCLNVQCRGDGNPYLPEEEGGLDSSDSRMLTAWFVDGKVLAALDTAMMVSGNIQSGPAWFQITPNGSSSHVASQGYLGVSGNNVIYPSIATDPSNNGAVALTLSGADHFPSAAYARWTPSGMGDVYTAAEGAAPEDGFCEYLAFDCANTNPPVIRPRWGDYAFAAFDGTNVWLASEYIAHSCTFAQFNANTTCGGTRTYYGNFSTRISQVTPGL